MSEVEQNSDSLMVDQYGNYFMQGLASLVRGREKL